MCEQLDVSGQYVPEPSLAQGMLAAESAEVSIPKLSVAHLDILLYLLAIHTTYEV
jgi:hypothetical protein